MTVIGPSLVNIASSLGSSLADVGWIMAIYATGSLVAQPVAGRLSDARGRRNVFIAALVVFTIGSTVCALSTTLGVLIAGRIVQSLGAGALQPAAIALIGQRVPRDRQSGALYAIYGMFALAGVLGAVLGGALIDGGRALGAAALWNPALRAELVVFPWHLIFWINLPIAAGALLLGLRLADDPPGTDPVRLDAGAMVLMPLVALFLMLAATGNGQHALLEVAAALAGLVVLAVWERRAPQPFFDPALFTRRGPLLLYAIAVVTGIPIFSVTMYSAAYYMSQFQASAAQAGLALLALAIPLGLGQGVGGRLSRRIDFRALLVAGIATVALGDGLLAALLGLVGVLAAFAVVGFGMGLASAPPNALMLRYVDEERSGAATGLLTMLSSTGAITAPALVTAFLHFVGGSATHGLQREFGVCCALAVLAVPLAVSLPEVGS